MAEAEAAKAKVDFTFATPEVKEALLAGMAASEKVLKEHDTSTQDQVNEQLNQLTALLKALDGQANLVKELSLIHILLVQVEGSSLHHRFRMQIQKKLSKICAINCQKVTGFYQVGISTFRIC